MTVYSLMQQLAAGSLRSRNPLRVQFIRVVYHVVGDSECANLVWYPCREANPVQNGQLFLAEDAQGCIRRRLAWGEFATSSRTCVCAPMSSQAITLTMWKLEMKNKEKFFTTAIMIGWTLYLLLQRGHPNDEAEHLHIAWLIQAQNLMPIKDFFEHHQPATWHLLGTLFQFGVNEEWLLFFGRVYVAFAVLLSALGLYQIARRSQTVGGGYLLLPIYYLMLSSLFFNTLLLIRPETFAVPFIIYCVLLWRVSFLSSRIDARFLAAAAGMLGMISVMISPRFALLAPGILLLYPAQMTVTPSQIVHRVLWGLLGSAAGFLLLLNIFDQTLHELVFNIKFSALLQQTGVGYYPGLPEMLFAGAASLPLYLICLRHSPYSAQIKRLFFAIFLLVYLISIYFMGKYFYAQGIFPFLVWVALFIASTPLQKSEPQHDLLGRTSIAVTVMAAVLCVYQLSQLGHGNIRRADGQRALLRQVVPAHESVLLPYPIHPIMRLDPGYYSLPILEGKNRLCDTIAVFDATPALPACDYHEAIQLYRPALVAKRFLPVNNENIDYARFISRNYSYNPDMKILIRKDLKIPDEPDAGQASADDG